MVSDQDDLLYQPKTFRKSYWNILTQMMFVMLATCSIIFDEITKVYKTQNVILKTCRNRDIMNMFIPAHQSSTTFQEHPNEISQQQYVKLLYLLCFLNSRHNLSELKYQPLPFVWLSELQPHSAEKNPII